MRMRMRMRSQPMSRGHWIFAAATLWGIGGLFVAPDRAEAQRFARYRQADSNTQPGPGPVVVPSPPPSPTPAPQPSAAPAQPPGSPAPAPAPAAEPASPESKPPASPPESEKPAASSKPQPPRYRNGLLFRYQMPCPPLPPDADRDTFYGTRYDDRDAPLQYHYWERKRGGLYGQLLPAQCTACNAPFFRGRPGGVIGPGCEASHPAHRLIHGAFHHLKPVGYYYSGGCWVPKYDLDPWVIGPDNFPYPFKRDHHRGG